MPKKQWETVMLSKETKQKLKQLKENQSYEAFIISLLTNSSTNSSTSSIDIDRLITEYLEPMKAYMKENTPNERIMQQIEQFTEDFNQMEAELAMARKRINVLIQDNDRLKKRKR